MVFFRKIMAEKKRDLFMPEPPPANLYKLALYGELKPQDIPVQLHGSAHEFLLAQIKKE